MNNYPIPVGVPTAYAQSLMFPVGEPNDAYAQYFTGRSWLAPVSGEQVSMANVTFEPGCINHWHIHHATKGGGQMLICVGGRGYAQIEGQEPIAMTPGTVVHIPANTKHWHGAAPAAGSRTSPSTCRARARATIGSNRWTRHSTARSSETIRKGVWNGWHNRTTE